MWARHRPGRSPRPGRRVFGDMVSGPAPIASADEEGPRRAATLRVRVRLWFLAWALWTGSVGFAVAESYVAVATTVRRGTATYWIACGALVASLVLRELVIRGTGASAARARLNGGQTKRLGSAWLLACTLPLIAGATRPPSFLFVALTSAVGAVLLSVTPPKITPDADPP